MNGTSADMERGLSEVPGIRDIDGLGMMPGCKVEGIRRLRNAILAVSGEKI